MVVKVYISGISGNKEVKKRQQRVLMILDSKTVKYDVIDITEPGKETDKEFMQSSATSNGGTVSDPNPRSPLPPQLFNDEEYCGDYDQFDLANEVDTLEQFLKLEVPPEEPQSENDKENTLNGDITKESKENSQEKEISETNTAENEVATEKEKSPGKEGTPSREATPVKDEEKKQTKEKTPEKESSSERQKSVDKEAAAEKEPSPAKETAVEKEPSPAKETAVEKEPSPAKETAVEKEPSPAKETAVEKEPSPAKETAVEKEPSPAKDTAVEKEPSPAKEVVEKHVTKENTPDVESANENGTVSSVVNEVTEKVERKKDPSELLIESEQSAE